jgi:prepilin-type N-terminal cleavage/methylation domain-containing protein
MRRESGFTLIEILIVLAIMAMLMGAVAFGIRITQTEGEKTKTRSLIEQIGGCLELVASPDNLGEYPPTNTAELRLGRKQIGKEIGVTNETNMGIESVAIVLYMPELDVGKRIEADSLINTDGDQAGKNLTTHAKLDLFEFGDAWGQPLVYIHHRDYDLYAAQGVETVNLAGETVFVKPRRNETTGTYYKLDSYQLISIGPDGEPDTDDDITNW